VSGQGVFFYVQFDRVLLVASQLAEVTDALTAVLAGADELGAVAQGNAGFTSSAAAVTCGAEWVAEVRRLGARVAAAGGHLTESVTTYQRGDAAAHDVFTALRTTAVA
jgi:hypothetical protein